MTSMLNLGACVLLCMACGLAPVPPLAPRAAPVASLNGAIVVLGDTQRTTWLEQMVGREQNEWQRVALIHQVAEENPAFVVHLGDMVEQGDSAASWHYFDRLMSPLTSRHIPVLPVLGNHEYWGIDHTAMFHARSRFGQLRNGGFYAMTHFELGLVWLDSNLSGGDADRQSAWLDGVLAQFQSDKQVRGVLVFTHHPAFTDGEIHEGDDYVIAEVLPRIRARSKVLALLSAHVHGYEHFVEGRRHFVVTGGAGGPRVTYRSVGANPARAFDPRTCDKRPFNYVVIERTNVGLQLTVKCLDCVGGVLDRFAVEYPASPD